MKIDLSTKKICAECQEEKTWLDFTIDKRSLKPVTRCKKCRFKESEKRWVHIKPATEGVRVCKICEVEKGIQEFAIAKFGVNGRRNNCRACTNKKALERYYDSSDRTLDKDTGEYKQFREIRNGRSRKHYRKMRDTTPSYYLLRNCRKRALKFGWEFNLDVTDLEIPEYCPILGLKLSINSKAEPHSASVDRIDNSKGYIKGNVIVCSWRANSIKKDATVEELIRIAEFYGRKK